MKQWFHNVWSAIFTVGYGLWVTLRYWMRTYDPERRTFTEHFEYPELPVPVSPRYRGFHRYDLTTCIACDQCAKACPVDCIYIGKERVEGGKGFKITGFTIDYSKCMFCGSLRGTLPCGLHFHGCHARFELLQPRRMFGGLFSPADGCCLGACDSEPHCGG